MFPQVRGSGVFGLITRRSQVQILPPLRREPLVLLQIPRVFSRVWGRRKPAMRGSDGELSLSISSAGLEAASRCCPGKHVGILLHSECFPRHGRVDERLRRLAHPTSATESPEYVEGRGCADVGIIVKADTPKPCVSHDTIECLRDDIGVKWCTVGTCEYEMGFRPRPLGS